LPFFTLLILALLAILQAVFYYPQLPDTVASHFGAHGEANGWSSKQTFFVIYFFALTLVVGIFLLLPALLRRLPISIINLPNKEYWLAPERREKTLLFLKDQMNRLGVATLSLLIATIHLAIQANLRPTKQMSASTMWVLLGVYALYTGRWALTFYRKFQRSISRAHSTREAS
jgi:uncharacterized membrane protein